MLDRKDFIKIGDNVRDNYRTHIFTKGLDVNNKKFKGYSTYGSKWVTMNVKDKFKKNAPKEGYSYKQAKEGDMLRRQASQYKNSTAPVLTTDLLEDFGTIDDRDKNGFTMGWSISGAKIAGLAKKGRLLTTKEKPLPDAVLKFMIKEVDMAISKNLGPDKTTVHKITRKK